MKPIKGRSLENLSEVFPFTEDIIALKAEAKSAKEKITERKKQIQQQIIDKKKRLGTYWKRGAIFYPRRER